MHYYAIGCGNQLIPNYTTSIKLTRHVTKCGKRQNLYSLVSNMLNFKCQPYMDIPEFLGQVEALHYEFNKLLPYENHAMLM